MDNSVALSYINGKGKKDYTNDEGLPNSSFIKKKKQIACIIM